LDPEANVANMHCHTFFSFNANGHSPTSLAWLAKRRGFKLMGIVDFDVLDGVDELKDACEVVGVRGSAGIETRVFIPEFTTRKINSPGEPGVYYHMGVGFASSDVPKMTMAAQGVQDYDELTEMAAGAPPFGPLVDPGDLRFLVPSDMPARIQAYCRDTGQPAPESRGEIVRCALESRALEYRCVTESLSRLVGKPLRTIQIMCGGSENGLLDQFTVDATGRTVVAGPVEATAIGNVLSQALALGQIGSLQDGRDLVRRSFEVKTFEPRDSGPWDKAYHRYLALLS